MTFAWSCAAFAPHAASGGPRSRNSESWSFADTTLGKAISSADSRHDVVQQKTSRAAQGLADLGPSSSGPLHIRRFGGDAACWSRATRKTGNLGWPGFYHDGQRQRGARRHRGYPKRVIMGVMTDKQRHELAPGHLGQSSAAMPSRAGACGRRAK